MSERSGRHIVVDLVYKTAFGMASITHATSGTRTSGTVKTFRSACITEHKNMPIWDEISAKIRYLAYAEETCPTTQKKHYQAFAYAHDKMKLTGWKKLFPTAHIEEMRGNFVQNEKYCSKEGKLIEFGERPTQGKRTDLVEVKKLIDIGKRPMEIVDEYDQHIGTVFKFQRCWNEYSDYKRQKILQNDRTKPQVYIRWGDPGTGKTRWLDDTFGFDGWRFAPDNNGNWFDGTDERDVVCFDDVKINEIPPIGKLLKLTHEYPCKVAKKGGFITWKPRVVVFTSNYPPDQWWNISTTDKNYQAFMRRVTKIEEVVYKTPELHACQDSIQEEETRSGDERSSPQETEEEYPEHCCSSCSRCDDEEYRDETIASDDC